MSVSFSCQIHNTVECVFSCWQWGVCFQIPRSASRNWTVLKSPHPPLCVSSLPAENLKVRQIVWEWELLVVARYRVLFSSRDDGTGAGRCAEYGEGWRKEEEDDENEERHRLRTTRVSRVRHTVGDVDNNAVQSACHSCSTYVHDRAFPASSITVVSLSLSCQNRFCVSCQRSQSDG